MAQATQNRTPGAPAPTAKPPTLQHPTLSQATLRRLHSHRDRLYQQILGQVAERHGWYRSLSASNKASVGLVAQASLTAFIRWCEDPQAHAPTIADLFSSVPAQLTEVISLQQTLQLVRTGVATIEEETDTLSSPGKAGELRLAVLYYSRELAFAAAEVYARAAEVRGSWDARLEALLVDELIRGRSGPTVLSRAAAAGWNDRGRTCAIASSRKDSMSSSRVSDLRRRIRRCAPDTLLGIYTTRVLVLVGGLDDPATALPALLPHLGDQVVVGPTVDSLAGAPRSIHAALAGLRALPGWPGAPRPVLADDLLPERLALGDEAAVPTLVTTIYEPLVRAGRELLETLWAYLDGGRALEATARKLFVHPNTVRYRLRKVSQLVALDPTDPREAYVLHTALVAGAIDPQAPDFLEGSDKRRHATS
jgi:hypothetical protein